MLETIVLYGNGVRTVFDVPGSVSKTVRVGGTPVTPSTQSFSSVTLSSAPGAGVPIEITYDEFVEPQTSLTAVEVAAVKTMVLGSYTGPWVNRPTSPALYDQIFITDIGPNGTNFWWNGTRWKVMFPTTLGENGNIITGALQTADQYLGGFGPFPVGLLQPGDVITYQVGLGKTGNAGHAFGDLSFRLGAGGVVGDSLIALNSAGGAFTTAIRSYGIEKAFRVVSNTTIRPLGPGNGLPSWIGTVSGAAPEGANTIINLSTTPWYIGVSATMPGAVEAPQLAYHRLVLLP